MTHAYPFLNRRTLIASAIGACLLAAGVAGAQSKPPPAALSAAQIIEKHIAARGGAAAWHSIQAISWSGSMEIGSADSAARSSRFARSGVAPSSHSDLVKESVAGAAAAAPAKQMQVPFTLTMQRPNKTRVELVFGGRTAIQVYDGAQGWKVRPFLNRTDAEPYSPEEVKLEQARPSLDGPLIDYAAKGTRVDLDGVETIDGRNAYKLKLTEKSGVIEHVWIDAQSFLDVKVEGSPRHMDDRMHDVFVYQRDFRNVQGVMVPFILETAVSGYPDTHKMLIEKVAVNPKLADTLFSKPAAAPDAKPAIDRSTHAPAPPNHGA